MGCLSSKDMSRSISLKGKLGQSLERRANGNPVLEELRISSNGRDQLLALVCTANLITNKVQRGSLKSESNTRNSAEFGPKITVASNTRELTASLEPGGVEICTQSATRILPTLKPRVVESMDVDLHKRSKSCHWYSEEEVMTSLALESFDEIKEDIYEWKHRGVRRARSFHTVDEFDAIVAKLWLSREQQTSFKDEDGVTRHPEDKTKGYQVEMLLNPDSAIKEPNVVEDAGKRQEGKVLQEGSKRKAIAKGLSPLSVPPTPAPTVEFPSVPSLREWIQVGGQVYSPGSYITPKFGHYPPLPELKSNQDVIISPELVAAFEESMRQLEAEEEGILKQLAENLGEECTMEKQDKEENESHAKD